MKTNNNIVVNVFWKFAERMLAQLVSLIVSIILARILLPDDYGAIAMITVFITIANVFVISGFPNALIQKKDADDTDFASVFYFNICFSVALYVVVFFCAPLISNFYNMSLLTPVIRVMGIRLIIASINSVQHAYVSRKMMFKKYFWSTLFGTVLSGIIGIWLAYNGAGVWALVAQYMTNTTVDTVVLWFTIDWHPKKLFSWQRLKTMIKFGWRILFEGVSYTVEQQLRSLIIGKVYSPGDLGFYTKAQQFPSLLITNINSSISSVMFPVMSIEQDNRGHVKELMRKAIRVSTYLLLPMLTGLAVVAEPFIRVILTDKWIECVPYLQIFCIVQAATIGMNMRHQALNAIGRSDVFMYEHIIYRITTFVILICVYKTSVMAIALSAIAGSVIMIVTVAYTSKRYNGYLYREQICDIAPTILGCVCMGVLVSFIQLIKMPYIVILCMQILAGTVIYLCYSSLLGLDGYKYLAGFIKKIPLRMKRR